VLYQEVFDGIPQGVVELLAADDLAGGSI